MTYKAQDEHRKEHKEDCQCAICTKVRGKAARVAVETAAIKAIEVSQLTSPEPLVIVDSRPTLNDLPLGSNFMYMGRNYKKIGGNAVQDRTKSDSETESLPGTTRVDVILVSHAVETDN